MTNQYNQPETIESMKEIEEHHILVRFPDHKQCFTFPCLESEYDYIEDDYIYTDGVYDDYYEDYYANNYAGKYSFILSFGIFIQ